MFELFRTPRIDFMKWRKAAFLFSGLVLVVSIAFIANHKRRTGDLMNYGIDFKGGSLFEVRFQAPPRIEDLRAALAKEGFGTASIQRYGDAEENAVLIRVSQQLEESHDLVARVRRAIRPPEERAREEQGLVDLNAASADQIAGLLEKEALGSVSASPDPQWRAAGQAVVDARSRAPHGLFAGLDAVALAPGLTPGMQEDLRARGFAGSLAFARVESVGPAVGDDLRRKAIFASVIANGLILLYLWMRFELRFGVAAVVCILHDLVFIMGVFALTERMFDLTVLAAVLTVIGYSVNDTIVVFDRMRSNVKLMRKAPLEEIINRSVNQTLSRTILTAGATLFVTVSLLVYGGEVLENFALALLIGVLEGTYSSIFVAAPLVLVWQRLFRSAPVKG